MDSVGLHSLVQRRSVRACRRVEPDLGRICPGDGSRRFSRMAFPHEHGQVMSVVVATVVLVGE